jgi:prevent-host-death family protein
MSGAPVVVTVSELRRNAAHLIVQVERSHDPVFVTQRGWVTAVLLSREEYGTLCVLRDKGLRAIRSQAGVSASPHPRDVDDGALGSWDD